MLASLFANIDFFRSASRHLSGSGSTSRMGIVVLIVVVIALVWLALTFFDKYRQLLLAHQRSPQALFRDLCRLHKLTGGERQLLLAVQAGSKPELLSCVFVDPRMLAAYATANINQADACRGLSRKLFGDLA